MTKFRPCIDLHDGKVKQIIGSSLVDSEDDAEADSLIENHVAEQPAAWFSRKYAEDELTGGHVIKLGAGNDEAARAALEAYHGGLQIGGGIHADNAEEWLNAGASHVIVTSWLFDETGKFLEDRLRLLVDRVGKHRVVLDLSCKRTASGWHVAMNRWQTLTELELSPTTLDRLAGYCDEFLIHAADVEGLCQGIDEELVALLGQWRRLPLTYAGGVSDMSDVYRVAELSGGAIDVTVGSALDLFGGSGVTYDQLLQFNSASG
ncbi:MAG: phosphoribosylformimino-5-aminoimidazole carboxamide ribotide isomerase [Planctomycetota bacterium]